MRLEIVVRMVHVFVAQGVLILEGQQVVSQGKRMTLYLMKFFLFSVDSPPTLN
jgi:pantothenate kinase